MWTYLLIFLSLLALLLVFIHRTYVVLFKKHNNHDDSAALETDDTNEPEEKEKKRLSKKDKEKVQEFYEHAITMIKRRDPKEAVKFLVKTLAVDPDFLDAQKQLGMLYIDQKMWGKGAAVYEHLVSVTGDPVDYSHLGLCLYSNEDLDGAANAYQNAINLDPERTQRYISLAQVYKEAGKPQLGLIAINKALEIDRGNLDYWLLSADFNLQLKNFLDARGAINKALEVAPMSKVAKKMLEDLEIEEQKARTEKPSAE